MNYFKALFDSIPENYSYKNLSKDSEPLYVFFPNNLTRKRVLIVAGLHGDEPAGPLGILKFLNQSNSKELLDRLSVSFIPVVNKYGFENNKRKNKDNQDVNRNYFSDNSSNETKTILNNLKLINNLSTCGFLTLHEDNRFDKFYLFTYGNIPELFDSIRDTGKKLFGLQTGKIDDSKLEDGKIENIKDQSFEHFLNENGSIGVCTETPSSKDLFDRVEANRQIINSFLRFYLL